MKKKSKETRKEVIEALVQITSNDSSMETKKSLSDSVKTVKNYANSLNSKETKYLSSNCN